MFSIAVVPSDKLICRSGYHKIVFSYGYLSSVSDKCLCSSFYHELYHSMHGLEYLFMFLFVFFVYIWLFFLIPLYAFMLLGLCMLFYYCWLSRGLEFCADLFALEHTNINSMICFLSECRDPEPWYYKMFWFFCLHPSIEKRYKNIVKKD